MAVFTIDDAKALKDKQVVLHDKTQDHLLCAVVLPRGIVRLIHMPTKDVVMDIVIGKLDEPASQKPPDSKAAVAVAEEREKEPDTEVDKMKREMLTFQIKLIRSLDEQQTRDAYKEFVEAKNEVDKAGKMAQKIAAADDKRIEDVEFRDVPPNE